MALLGGESARRKTSIYRRLLAYLRPHWWRMAGNIACNLVAAVLAAYSYTLLIPFLSALFQKGNYLPANAGIVEELQRRTIGALLDPAHPRDSLRAVIFVIIGVVAVKNFFVWWA